MTIHFMGDLLGRLTGAPNGLKTGMKVYCIAAIDFSHDRQVLGIGILLDPSVPIWMQPYLPIAVIAALDAVFGAVRAVLDGIFNDKVFVVSFLSNVVVAAFIVFLGDQLGVGSQLSTGVVVVLGVRIFSNVASIRRHLFRA
jgi:small basic protein